MPEFRIEAYDGARHRREGFSCGKPSLDAFLHHQVTQYEKRRLGRTYVALEGDQQFVRGYYTLASSSITVASLPKGEKKLPRHPVPVILLARLAVDQSMQKCGLGRLLLIDSLKRTWEVSRTIGAYALEVHALDDDAAAFYDKFGFLRLEDDPRHLILAMKTIDALFSPARRGGK